MAAPWHRPIDQWFVGDTPIVPLPTAERWPTFGPSEHRGPRRGSTTFARDMARQLAGQRPTPAEPPPTPEELARLHAASRARAAARGRKEIWEGDE